MWTAIAEAAAWFKQDTSAAALTLSFPFVFLWPSSVCSQSIPSIWPPWSVPFSSETIFAWCSQHRSRLQSQSHNNHSYALLRPQPGFFPLSPRLMFLIAYSIKAVAFWMESIQTNLIVFYPLPATPPTFSPLPMASPLETWKSSLNFQFPYLPRKVWDQILSVTLLSQIYLSFQIPMAATIFFHFVPRML